MKLLFLSPGYPPQTRSGIATHVQAVAQAMVRHGHQAHVLTSETEGGPPDSEDEGVHVHRRTVRHIPGMRRLLGQVSARWVQERLPQQAMTRPGRRLGLGFTSLLEASALGVEFDLVEAPDYFAAGWAIALTRRWPVLTVFHTPLAVEARYSGLPDRAYVRAAAGLEQLSAGLSQAWSAPSRLIRDELSGMGWTSATRASVEPYGIDVSRIGFASEPPTPGRVLIAGHINRRKGHDILAQAAALAASSIPDLEIVSVGSMGTAGFHNDVPYHEYLLTQIRRLGIRWQFLDHISRESLLELYSTAQLVVVPSRFESFSLAGLEGMLTGRPVIVSDRTGLAEWAASVPDSGLTVVPAGDSAALATAMNQILSSPAQAQHKGELARRTALEIGDVDRLIPDRERLYQRVIQAS
jgi:glycogen(starch) synthase